MKKIFSKALHILVDILIVIVLIISTAVVVMSVSSKSTGVPSLFGYSPLSVQSNSMVPTFQAGDMIIGKISDENTQYNVGDVVTFGVTIQGVNTYNTHRIHEITQINGETCYVTKGDNNVLVDDGYRTRSSIVAVYTGDCIQGGGSVMDFFGSQLGFFLCILLPMILFFLFQLYRVIRNLIAYNKTKAFEEGQAAAQTTANLSDEEKKRVAEEYLASLNVSGDSQNKNGTTRGSDVSDSNTKE